MKLRSRGSGLCCRQRPDPFGLTQARQGDCRAGLSLGQLVLCRLAASAFRPASRAPRKLGLKQRQRLVGLLCGDGERASGKLWVGIHHQPGEQLGVVAERSRRECSWPGCARSPGDPLSRKISASGVLSRRCTGRRARSQPPRKTGFTRDHRMRHFAAAAPTIGRSPGRTSRARRRRGAAEDRPAPPRPARPTDPGPAYHGGERASRTAPEAHPRRPS